MSAGKWKILKAILLLGSVLAALKLIFVDYTLDEEYQIVMAYRRLIGDDLFKQMWEPHQTSAFLCAGLMKLYMIITGTTTGVILFLRFFTLAVQILLARAVYRTVSHITEKEYAFLLGLLYFNIVPKNIQIPEFSNMQLWFLTIPVLLMMKYLYDKEQGKKDRWYLLIGVGISLSCEILTYPTCIVLFPFFLFYIWKKSGQGKWRDWAVLSITCAVCGGLWLFGVTRNVGLQEMFANVENMLSFDLTHAVSGMTDGKLQNYRTNLVFWGVMLAAVAAVSGGMTAVICWWKNRKKAEVFEKKSAWMIFWVLAVVVAECIQLYYWMADNRGYEYPQIHLLVVLLAAAVSWRMADERKKPLSWGIVATLIAYAAVMYISDLALYYTLPHGVLGIVFCSLVLVLALQNIMGKQAKRWLSLLLVSLCFCSILGKGYTLRAGRVENTILSVGSIMKNGPAVGILAEYMCAYIYNCNYEDYGMYVQPGDNVLIVANMVMSASTTPYMFEDVEICHYSIVDPTAYDERLLAYWEQYPEKQPNVIVVDCWYGQLKENPDNWIMQYIENEFGYTSVQDGKYVRFYRR